MGRSKITVVGAGFVGGTIAQRLVETDSYDVVLLDVVEGLPQGKALDLSEASPICGFEPRIVGTNRFDDTADSSLVVVVAGVPRKPGMSRDQLLETNTRIVRAVVRDIVARSPLAIILMVTNPLDAMTYVAYQVSQFPKQRIVGMAGVLDSIRFRTFIANELNVSVDNVQAIVLGCHGDSMVPLVRYTTVAGRPIEEWISKDTLQALVKRTRKGGGEIVSLLKTGSAYYAPAASVVEMVEAILKDQKKILPAAALCEGEYGIHNLFAGVPVKFGSHGVEEIVVFDLTPEEQVALEHSVNAVRAQCQKVDQLLGCQA
ncbi:malate dehydrogenase [Candidatus Nitronereus thalassa]|uniref:Malate dehydrogenase n=1 Tax=Candidatus Nitronereus thalassa TaxID=3020898 RepID=A0ABU3K2Z1_9BACT|nr:malate dehydrogenase [Candidatus Nitronereus thalassa]MDT7040762.1 malate dehydrogenase [Candidatus Nitronereus thalassa]